MSSGLRSDPRAGNNLAMGAASRIGSFGPEHQDSMNRIGRLGLSPRQQEMNRLWSYYTCSQYSNRQTDFDGRPHLEPLDKDAIASASYIPPGFYDAGGQTVPLKLRHPSAPYHLVKVIVDRFTGLLFSQKRHPKLEIDGDPISEDYVNALAEVGRLWPAMLQARTFGGATGTAVVGFQFINGRLQFEVHDSRWVVPQFIDRSELILGSIEKRYIYPTEVRDPETGGWIEVPTWYRRVINDNEDVIFAPVPVGDGEEPDWQPARIVEHGFGFCPVQWMQNMPVIGDVDGMPDCHGIYDMVEEIDLLQSSASRAIIANCDPTVVIATDAEMQSVRKGSDNAIKLPSGSSASYMEIAGGGPAAAREIAKERREQALEVAQCFLESEGQVPQTATEIERRYSSMLSKADVLREQYGERGVKPLMEKVVKAVRKLSIPTIMKTDKGSQLMRRTIYVPPKVDDTGKRIERKLSPQDIIITTHWPRYFEPSLQDAQLAVQAAGGAKASNLVDDKHAIGFIAEYFQIDDVGKLVADMQKAMKEQQAELEQMAMGGGGEEEL